MYVFSSFSLLSPLKIILLNVLLSITEIHAYNSNDRNTDKLEKEKNNHS